MTKRRTFARIKRKQIRKRTQKRIQRQKKQKVRHIKQKNYEIRQQTIIPERKKPRRIQTKKYTTRLKDIISVKRITGTPVATTKNYKTTLNRMTSTFAKAGASFNRHNKGAYWLILHGYIIDNHDPNHGKEIHVSTLHYEERLSIKIKRSKMQTLLDEFAYVLSGEVDNPKRYDGFIPLGNKEYRAVLDECEAWYTGRVRT